MTTARWQPDQETPRTYARLSGDHNPVHLEPEVARAAGFPGVVVHGMCVLGAAARAAALAAPHRTLRKLDVRFAGPVFPGNDLQMEPTTRELPDGTLRVSLKVAVEDRSLISPANFVFGDAVLHPDLADKLLEKVETRPLDDDVVAEPYTFGPDDVSDYLSLTCPDPRPGVEAIPMLMGTLGLTDALWFAFGHRKPEEPGNWVHLRQSGVFVVPIRTGVTYRCRVQAGLTVVRKSPAGAMVTIPFTVVESGEGSMVQAGTVTLLYVIER